MTGVSPRPEVVAAVARRYQAIGGGSPLPDMTRRQAAALQVALSARLGANVNADPTGIVRDTPSAGSVRETPPTGSVRVRPGFLYCAPTVAQCLAGLDASRTIVLPLSPYSSRLTTGAYRAALAAAGHPDLPVLDGWYADPRYLAALSRRVNAALDGADPSEFALLFTAHNVPLETVTAGDPYVDQLRETATSLVPALMPGTWRLAFQSKGRRGGEWLEPEAATAVREFAEAGWKKLLVVPLGFVADHVETLYDLDIELREIAVSSGMDFLRCRALNDSPGFIAVLADLVSDYLAQQASRPVSAP